MIILRQRNFSILNKVGVLGNLIGNVGSVVESNIRRDISRKKSPELKKKLLEHVGKYHEIKDSNEGDSFFPNGDNLVWEKGKEPGRFEIFVSGPDPDRVKFERVKRGGGTININKKKTSPFRIAHEYGHSLDFASKGGHERFTEDLRNKNKSDVKSGEEALNLSKSEIEREVAANINALKLLKKKGATQRELDRAKQEAKSNLRTYKTTAKAQINDIMSDSSLSDDLKFRREHMRGARKQYKDAVRKIDNMYGPNKLAQKEKAALIGTGALLAAGTGAYLLHKHRKKKKEQKEEENKK